jgi:16S rRNA (guanine527-N7)-methyltransferase
MGQSTDKNTLTLIRETLNRIGIDRPEQAETLEIYARELLRWNRRINLTGAATVEKFVQGPLFDALTLMPILDPSGTLIDVGSGGGLPGIPVAILSPETGVTLIEPRAKRAAFLRHVAGHLQLPLEILEARDDALPDRKWRNAVAQAVWPPDEWIGRALKLVETGGSIHVLSSRPVKKSALPPSVVPEAEERFVRPFDNAARYSTRLRVT